MKQASDKPGAVQCGRHQADIGVQHVVTFEYRISVGTIGQVAQIGAKRWRIHDEDLVGRL